MKKQFLIPSAAVLFIFVGLVFLLWPQAKPIPPPVVVHKIVAKKIVKAPVYISPLSGLAVTQAQSQLPITAVMVENSDEARPQSGLSQAGVVFEALTEGGITRFMALYQEGAPGSIGPIRSARPIFIDALLPFNAAYAHVGGSSDALTQIISDNVKDMNEFYYGGYYTRISSREAPHNVYTSMSELYSLEQSKGYYSPTSFVQWPRKAEAPSKLPTVTAIKLNPSGPDFAVSYTYNPTANDYMRDEAGAVMVDANTGAQLTPKVVIALVIPSSQGALDASGAYYTDYSDIGSGQADIFQDGTVTTGTWSKSTPSSQLVLTDNSGIPIALNSGQIWITVLSQANQVSY